MSELPTNDLLIVEGEDFQVSLQLLDSGAPEDLTGGVFEGQIRAGFADTDPVLATLTFTAPVPTTGEVFMSLSAAATSGLKALVDPYAVRRPTGYYDVFYTPVSGVREYLVGGRVLFKQTITRSV